MSMTSQLSPSPNSGKSGVSSWFNLTHQLLLSSGLLLGIVMILTVSFRTTLLRSFSYRRLRSKEWEMVESSALKRCSNIGAEVSRQAQIFALN